MKINELKRPWIKSTSYQGARNNDTSFYRTSEWIRVRKEFLSSNPNCCICGNKAQMVDHKKRILDGGDKINWNNLQPMCNSCHASKSAKERNLLYKK